MNLVHRILSRAGRRPHGAAAFAGFRLLLALGALAATVSPTPLFAQAEPKLSEGGALKPGSVEGMLLAPSGSGTSIEGVTVLVVESGEETTTDRQGHFSFSNLRPGTYTLVASGKGFSRLRITDVVVRPGHGLTLSPESMPIVLRNGEIVTMEEVVVSAKQDVQVMDEYVVTEKKAQPFVGTNNIDLPRTIDDVQPYYIWDANKIETSGAVDVQDFFQRMVPMDTNRQSYSQQPGASNAPGSNISIGGLSNNSGGLGSTTSNTLLLVDGLPLPNLAVTTVNAEPDLNGIPLSAIDHIEVLPASASAIYGAAAAGGVVNIVLKHDYSGAELKYTYDNTFNTDAPTRSLAVTVGQNLEGGKTNLLFTATYQTEKPLLLQDRLSQIVGPYQARFFSGYPGGELADLGLTNASGAFTTSSAASLSQPIITSSTGTPLFAGSSATTVQVPQGYQSFSANGIAPLQSNIGNFNLSHPNTEISNGIGGLRVPLTLGPTEKAFEISLRRQMTGWLEVYARFLNSSDESNDFIDYFVISGITVPAGAPGNPFGQAVKVSGEQASNTGPYVGDNVTHNLSVGAKLSLPDGWKADLNYTWGVTNTETLEEVPDTAALQAAVTSGAVNLIADLSRYPINISAYPEIISSSSNSSVDAVQLKAAGPLLRLWAGAPSLAVGIEHNKNGAAGEPELIQFPVDPTLAYESIYFPGASVSDDSAYTELTLPLVSKANGLWGVKQVDLQAAGRYDSIQEFTTSPVEQIVTHQMSGAVSVSPLLLNGQPEPLVENTTRYRSSNGTIGLRYKPVDDVFFRVSFATAFVPPTYAELRAPISTGTVSQPTGAYPGVPTTSPWNYQSITDPVLNATYDVPVITGGNANLKPETSHNIDWGVVFEPTFLKGLRVSLDYTKVTKFNDILVPAVATLIASPALYPGRVTRGTPNSGQAVGPIVLIDDTDINAPETITSSYNLEVDYTLRTASAGSWTLSGIANSWQHYQIQSTVGGPFVEQLGNPFVSGTSLLNGVGAGLAKFKGNLGLDWSKGPFSAGWLVRYVGPYNDGAEYGIGGAAAYEVDTPNGWVSGQIYHDAHVGYRIGKAPTGTIWWKRLLADTSVQFGVRNLFSHIPPYDGTTVGGLGSGLGLYVSGYGDVRLADYYLTVKKKL